MKKTRFLRIRDLPAKCRENELRDAFERYGSIQTTRIYKDGSSRHALLAFVDVKSAVRAANADNRFNSVPLKVEYCDTFDTSGITLKLPDVSLSSRHTERTCKEQLIKRVIPNTAHETPQQGKLNDQSGRPCLLSRKGDERVLTNIHTSDQVLRSVQSSALPLRTHTSLRGLKLSNLPPVNKLSDELLRQGLFTEFRRCGRIQSIVLPGSNSPASLAPTELSSSTRVAIVTFRRPEEAESAYQAIRSGEKLLFSTSVLVEHHPGFAGPEECPPKAAPNAHSVEALSSTTTICATLGSHPNSRLQPTQFQNTQASKCPTRTLYVAGLTAGPTGPVTADQLTTAFRKFGDIIDVQLQTSSDSALIQFAEMRGPIRAMNAHSRDPLRLGGRPLHLAYVPSPPSLGLWFSDLPPSLASLNDRELIQSLSRLAPVLEITLINRTDPNVRLQPTSPASAKPQQSLHYAAYIRLSSMDYASQLLSELRSGKHFCMDVQPSPTVPSSPCAQRRPFAVDFASPRQTILVNSLQLNAARSGGSARIRIINAEKCTASPVSTNNQLATAATVNSLRLDRKVDTPSDVRSQRSSDSTNSSRLPAFPVKSDALPLSTRTVDPGASSPTARTTLNTTFIKPSSHDSATSKSSRPVDTSSALFTSDFVQSIDRTRDTSPSSMSTSSSSSSLSSESSSSSVSSSTSSSVSSSSSSPSSTRSKSRRALPNTVGIPNSAKPSTPNANKVTRRGRATQGSSTRTTKKLSASSPGISARVSSSSSVASSHYKPTDAPLFSWSVESGSHSLAHPLSIMTTTAPTVVSPSRSPAASSCGLSSPGGSCSSAAVAGLSNSIRTSHGDRSTDPGSTPDHRLPTSTVLSSSTPHASTGTLLPGSFRAVHNNTLSASSGVSSGGRSFSSTSSNSSTGSSPLTGGHLSALQTSDSKRITGVTSNQPRSLAVSMSLSSTVKSGGISSNADASSRATILRENTQSWSAERKSRLYCTEVSSGLKLHLSTNCPSSRSPASVTNATTNPLTVSIKLNGSCQDPQSGSLTSPSALSTHSELFGSGECRRGHDSQPLSPVSAPPLNCNSSIRGYTPSTDVGCEKPSSEYAAGGMSTHSADWFGVGSPVYESMYDKIKRRTNKEAEERRQRQMEVSAAREKQRRKQRKKEDKQLTKSPTVSCTPPGSFGSEHSVKTAFTNSSSKSHRSKSSRSKRDTSFSKLDLLHSKEPTAHHPKDEVTINGRPSLWNSKHYDNMWSNNLKATACRTGFSKEPTAHKTKRRRRNHSPLSSSISSEDGRNSASPPGTLTRLSLGMRFPVSATYHECVRAKGSPNSKWSIDDDNESLGRLSSSLSCSSSDKSLDRFRNKPKTQQRSHPKSSTFVSSKEYRTQKSSPKFCFEQDARFATKLADTGFRHLSHSSQSATDARRKSPINKIDHSQVIRSRKFTSNALSKVKLTSAERSKHSAKTLYSSTTKHPLGAKRPHDGMTELGKVQKKRCMLRGLESALVSKSEVQRMPSSTIKRMYESRLRSPQSYFSDDATVLDSETEDIKCSYSISHTTGASDYNGLKWSQQRHPLTCALHSGTDDSSLPVTRSPSPITCRSPIHLGSKHSKQDFIGNSACLDDTKSSAFDAFIDADRFSTTSKSTPSTEPMEQAELIERDLGMKFSDDEWHSSVSSTSPHPANIDFDMDYCPIDRTEQSSTTYQSTSFSSQMLSPAGKLPSPIPDESDDDSMHREQESKFPFESSIQIQKEIKCSRNSHASPSLHENEQEHIPTKEEPPAISGEAEHTLSSPPNNDKPAIPIECVESNLESIVISNTETDSLKVSNTRVDSGISLTDSQSTIDAKQCVKLTDCTVSSEGQTEYLASHSDRRPTSINGPTTLSESPSNQKASPFVELKTSSSNCSESLVSRIQLAGDSTSETASYPKLVFCDVNQPLPASVPNDAERKQAPTSPTASSQVSEPLVEHSKVASCSPSLIPPVSVVDPAHIPNKFDHISVITPSSGSQTANQTVHMMKKPHTTTQETAKGTLSIMSPSAGPLTEVHDITRYVQSVIERVKAERVEETQQAAAAAAQYHSPNVTVSSPSFSTGTCAQSVRCMSDLSHSVCTASSNTATVGRRSGNSQRKPLLLTTSACSSTKSSSLNSNVKWSVASNSTSTSSTSVLSSAATSCEPVTCAAPVSLNPTGVVPTTTEIQVPAIPGVNACAPLAISQPQLTHIRVTRQSLQQAQLQTNVANKRADQTSAESVPPTSSSSISTRRRRRSESKVSVSSDTVTVSVPSPTPALSDKPQVKMAQHPLTCTSVTTSNKQTVMTRSTDDDTLRSSTQPNTGLVNSSVSSSTTKVQSSVDPYEPNFDDESPPGFDHTQLHHHRSTSPAGASPAVHQASVTAPKKPAPIAVTSVATGSPQPANALSSANQVAKATLPTSVSPSGISAVVPPPSTTVASTAGHPDSVDEVIRDVCAGQFDVESYLNSWKSEQSTSKEAISPKTNSAQSVLVTTTAPVLTSPIISSIPKISPTSVTLPTKSFPIALASEPVVAAVTIPVSSSATGGKSVVPGKNGSNDIVNIVNTLLAVLRSIPGSQVTVTGQTGAAGVGGFGTGTISATTITLPVNAARQAAANIKAAVLSATNAIPTSIAESQNQPVKKAAADPPGSELQSSSIPALSSNVTGVGTTGLPSSIPLPTVTSSVHPTSSHPEVHRVSPGTVQSQHSSSPFVTPVQGNAGTGRVKRHSGTSLKHVPSKTPDLVCVETATSAESQAMNVMRQLKPVSHDCLPPSSRASMTVPNPQHIPGLPIPSMPMSSFGVTPQRSSPCVHPPNVSQLHAMGTVSTSVSLPSPQLSNATGQQQPHNRTSNRAPSAPLLPGRSPPLSAPPMTNPAIQTLVDRLGGIVEPSVLMALAQAAVNGGPGLCASMNGTVNRMETEAQLVNYLRRYTQQLNDTRSCVGLANSKQFTPTNILETQVKVPPRVSVSSPNTTPLILQPKQQQRLPLSVVSSLNVTTLGADAALAAVAVASRSNGLSDTGTLISPPIPQSRPASNQPTSVATTTITPTTHPSWPSLSHAYPLVWQGRLSLKNAETRVALHYIYGNPNLLHDCMRLLASGGGGQPQHSLVASGGPLRIVQRMRLEPAQLEGVQRKIHQDGASCVCLAIPAGNDPVELMQQTQILNDNFIRYMQEKMAAGIINVGFPDYQQGLYVVHIFPPCEFSHTQLELAAPDLNRRVIQANQSHLLVVITTV